MAQTVTRILTWTKNCNSKEGYTCALQGAGIILSNCKNSETCNKKKKPPFHDHLEYLPIQNPLSGWRLVGGCTLIS